ncbi:MAG: helix-turn-helix domain-containing protein [Flavobacteriaceae bacterium]
MRYIYAFFFCFFFLTGFSQSPSQSYLDELEYEALLNLFNEFEYDSLSQEKIARTYLNRARKEGDTVKIARGYDRLARAFSPLTNIKYADSLIEYTKEWDHITYPGMGYILKAKGYGSLQNLKKEFDYYKLAYQYSSRKNNISQKVYTLSILVLYRATWGNKLEALKWQHQLNKLLEDPDYIKKTEKETRKEYRYNNDNIYIEQKLNTNFSYIYALLKNNQFDSSKIIIKKYYNDLNNYNDFNKEIHHDKILDLAMEVEFFSRNYRKSLEYRDSIISKNNRLSPYDLKRTLLFGGLSKIKLNMINDGISDLKKADSIYNIHCKLFDYFDKRFLYETLINYTDDINKKLYYNKIIFSIDSTIKINYQYVEPEMINKFETPELLNEKENEIFALKNSNQQSHTLLYITLTTLGVASLFAAYFYRRQRLYKKRFQSLLDIHDLDNNPNALERNALEGISIEIVKDIQDKLLAFELKKTYLKNDITLQSLAKIFETNANYLSRVINSTTQKNFSQYLNELRINYAVEAIRFNPEFKKYTIDAIAKECGYNSGTSFSRVFYKQTGIYPSYYIENLSKITPESVNQ